jgi:hypothetical protein
MIPVLVGGARLFVLLSGVKLTFSIFRFILMVLVISIIVKIIGNLLRLTGKSQGS